MNLRERSLKRGVERPKRPLELAKRGLNLIFSRTYSLIYSMNTPVGVSELWQGQREAGLDSADMRGTFREPARCRGSGDRGNLSKDPEISARKIRKCARCPSSE
jgi:hypothetical protein